MSLIDQDKVASVLLEVMDERRRQHAKWGEQNHPDGTGPSVQPLAFQGNSGWRFAERLSIMARRKCERSFRTGVGTYRDILLEEVFEALAESKPNQLRAELIQVAAVAVQWVEAIDRRAES